MASSTAFALGKVRQVVEAPAIAPEFLQPPGHFNGTCFGCIVNGYRYCSKQQGCIPIENTCNTKVAETSYTQVTGCPVKSKCGLGLNGTFYIDTGNAASGGLDTSVDSSVVLRSMSPKAIAANPDSFPCALVLYNFPQKNLDFQISGPNVGLQVLTLTYPNNY